MNSTLKGIFAVVGLVVVLLIGFAIVRSNRIKDEPPEPTVEPTTVVVVELTTEPTVEPTAEPTTEPTVEPTTEPTVEPTTMPTTTLSGRLLDTNSFVDSSEEVPVVGATITLLDSGVVTTSDAQGNFVLHDVPAGSQIFDIDTTTAAPGPDGVSYAGFREKLIVEENIDNVVERPFYLPRIADESLTTVDPTTITVVRNETLGIEVEVAPESAHLGEGENFTGQLSISEVPDGLAPAALPDTLEPALLITIQPVGVTFDPPAPITFPNVDNLPAGSEADIWSLDPESGTFVVVGIGKVTADGKNIETISGGIRAADWHAPLPPRSSSNDSNNNSNQDDCKCLKEDSGSETALATGALSVDHDLVSYSSQGMERGLRLSYNSLRADPQPIISSNVTIAQRGGVPQSVSVNLYVEKPSLVKSVADAPTAGPVYWNTSGLNESKDETILTAVQFDAADLLTGIYPYQLVTTNHYDGSSVGGSRRDTVIVDNRSDSPYGAGWNISGLQRLYIQEDESLLLTDGDGSATFYRALGEVMAQSNFDSDAEGWQPIGDTKASMSAPAHATELDDSNGYLSASDAEAGIYWMWRAPQPFLGDKSAAYEGTLSFDLRQSATSNPAANVDDILLISEDLSLVYETGFNPKTAWTHYTVPLNADGGWLKQDTGEAPTPEEMQSVLAELIELRILGEYRSGEDSGDLDNVILETFDGTVLAGSTFDNDDEGWEIMDGAEGRSGAPTYLHSGGNPGGHIYAVDEGTGESWYWEAPDKFTIDATAEVGGLLSFDLKQEHNDRQSSNEDIILSSSKHQIMIRNLPHPSTEWTSYDIALDTTANWEIQEIFKGGPGLPNRVFIRPATMAEIEETVANLQSLVIRGEYRNGPDSSGIDNVVLRLPPKPGTTTFRTPRGDYSTIHKNDDGTYIRILRNGTQIHFDSDGLQRAVVDTNGNTTSYEYDAEQRLERITDPVGLQTTLSYQDGRLASITDPVGRTTIFKSDAQGNLIEIIDPDGSARIFDYDDRHRLIEQVTKRGFSTIYDYDFAGRHFISTLSDGSVRAIEVAEVSGLVDPQTNQGTVQDPAPVVRMNAVQASFTDGEGRKTTRELGYFGEATRTVDPAGLVTEIERDKDGNSTSITLPSGHVLNTEYDSTGNLTTVTDQTVGGENSFTYESDFNRMTSMTNDAGHTTNMTFDDQGNLTSLTSPLERSLTVTYYDQGLASEVTDALGTTMTLHYDEIDRLASVIQGSGVEQRTLGLTYTDAGDVQKIIDPLGQTYEFDYDPMGRLIKQTSPGDLTAEFDYDIAGNLTEVTPPGQPSHLFIYDEMGNVVSYIPSAVEGLDTTATTYAYNMAQQLTNVTRPDGLEIVYGYDHAGRLETVSMPHGKLQYEYNSATGLLDSITAPDDVSLEFDYKGELLVESSWTGPISGSVGRTYDGDYRVKSLSVNDDAVSFAYDDDDALIQAGEMTLSYDASSGLPAGSILGVVEDKVDFNQFGEPAAYSATAGGNELFATVYERDKLGRIVSLTETIDGVTTVTSYEYDAAGRLAKVMENGVTTHTYSYDANGNRLSFTDSNGTISGTYDDQDRLLQFGSTSYTFTPNGELTSKTTGPSTTLYDYDEFSNLLGVTLADGSDINYLVDGENRRIGKQVNGTLTQGFLYQDALNPIAELDGSGNVISRFVYGSRINVPDYIIKRGETYRIIPDHLGSVRLVVNTTTGVIAQQLNYDAFGRVTLDTNPGFQPFGFAGGIYDADTGLVRFGARDYDPMNGRWTGKDPILFNGGSANLYSYTINDPVNYTDTTGYVLDTVADVGFIIYDLYRLGRDNVFGDCDNLGENLAALGADSVGLLVPFATGGGLAVRGGARYGDDVVEGIYEFTAGSGKTYVGQSKNIPQRLQQHIKSGKLSPDELGNVRKTPVSGGKTAREIAEQRRIDELGGITGLENKVNPIGPKRRHLLK